jgi:hypothetical protein
VPGLLIYTGIEIHFKKLNHWSNRSALNDIFEWLHVTVIMCVDISHLHTKRDWMRGADIRWLQFSELNKFTKKVHWTECHAWVPSWLIPNYVNRTRHIGFDLLVLFHRLGPLASSYLEFLLKLWMSSIFGMVSWTGNRSVAMTVRTQYVKGNTLLAEFEPTIQCSNGQRLNACSLRINVFCFWVHVSVSRDKFWINLLFDL